MKKEILSEELNAMKYLLGYKRGVVISEQQVGNQKFNFNANPALTQGGINYTPTAPADMYKNAQAAVASATPATGTPAGTTTTTPAAGSTTPVGTTTTTPAAGATTPAGTTTPAPATATPATNLSMPELIKKIQTILKTKFSATLGTSGPNKDGIDGVWGKNSQAAFENALKTLSTKEATTPAGTTTTAPAGTTTTAPAYNFNVDPNLGKGGIGFNRMTPEQLVQGVQSATPPKLPTRDESIAKAKADLKAARGMK
jgi:hypothetical protein